MAKGTLFSIRELRKKSGITQAQLAEKLHVKSASTINMWESGARNPPSWILPQLADALNSSIDGLYRRK